MLTGFNNWLWEPFDFTSDTIGDGPYYYLLLDFSENSFTSQTSVEIFIDDEPVIDLLNDVDKIVMLNITESSKCLTIVQRSETNELIQSLDLTSLILEPE